MLFWKYLREFLIFRWLFGSDRHEEHTGRTQSNTDHVDCNHIDHVDCNHDAYCDYARHSHDGHSHSYYDPLEDPDDFDDYTSRCRGQDYYDSMYGGHDDYGSSYGDYDDYDSMGAGFDDFDADDW